ncbi:carboxymuconolactone decarboxylase family protein [Streptomyces sp900105245]|uniref:Carboxymuconolactone decarboxylase family protein n=1 Tax=Streptomyces sp. 900105245 TaxID=3154379 RepID=A0ABV1UL09_9ACTN
MPRLSLVDTTTASPQAKTLLNKVENALGVTPNMMRAMAVSSAVLDAYLSFSGSLSKGALSGAVREQIALVTAVENHCEYCYAAHHVLGERAGVSTEDLKTAGSAQASDPKVESALQFAKTVIETRGFVSDEALDAVRAAGHSDGEIGEIVANIALNIFTNYFNSVARTEIDFPAVALPSK